MPSGGYDLRKASKSQSPSSQGSFRLKRVQHTTCHFVDKVQSRLNDSMKCLYLGGRDNSVHDNDNGNANANANGNVSNCTIRASPISFRESLFDSNASPGYLKRRYDIFEYTQNDIRHNFDLMETNERPNYIFGTNIYNFSSRNFLNGKSTMKILNKLQEIEDGSQSTTLTFNKRKNFNNMAQNSLQRLKDERKTIFKELLELSSCDESLEYRLVKDYLECNSYSEIENDAEFKDYLQRKNYTDILCYLNDGNNQSKSLLSISSSLARAQTGYMGKGSLNNAKYLSYGPKTLLQRSTALPIITPDIESHVCNVCRSIVESNKNRTIRSPMKPLKTSQKRDGLALWQARQASQAKHSKQNPTGMTNNIFTASYREVLKYCQEFFEESFHADSIKMPKFIEHKFNEQKYEKLIKDFILQQGYNHVDIYVEDRFGKFIDIELAKYCNSNNNYNTRTSCAATTLTTHQTNHINCGNSADQMGNFSRCGYCDQMHSEEMKHLVPASLHGKEDILFGNLHEIYTFHNDVFLKDLENCISTTELVALCFVQRRDTFYRLYSFYCQNVPRSDHLRETLVDTHLFLQECQKRLGHRLSLGAYLLKPVQRISKYQLLLKDLLRHSDSGNCTKELQKALDCMLIVLKCVNDSMHQVAISGFPADLAQQGELLLQDSFQVWSDSKKDIRLRLKPRQRYIFLYQKSMLFCKQTSKAGHDKTTYQFKHYLKMSQIGLTESVRGDSSRFEVWLQGRQEVHTLQAHNLDIKNKWVAEIKRVLFNQLEELKGEKIKQYGSNFRGLRQTTSWDTPNILLIGNNMSQRSTISTDASSESSNRNSNCSSSDDNYPIFNSNCGNSTSNLSSNPSNCTSRSTDKEHADKEACGWSSDYSNSEDEMSTMVDNNITTPRFKNFLIPWSSHHHHQHNRGTLATNTHLQHEYHQNQSQQQQHHHHRNQNNYDHHYSCKRESQQKSSHNTQNNCLLHSQRNNNKSNSKFYVPVEH